MNNSTTKAIGFVVAIIITFIFAITPTFAYATTDSTVYVSECEEARTTIPQADDGSNSEELKEIETSMSYDDDNDNPKELKEIGMPIPRVDDDSAIYIEEVDWYYYYDLDESNAVDISDLVCVKKAMDAKETFSISDYELVRNLVTTGTTESKMHCTSISLDGGTFNIDKRLQMNAYTKGKLVDILIDGDVLKVRHLVGNCRITEIRISQHDSCDTMPIVYAFNFKDLNVGIGLSDDGALVWDSFPGKVQTTGPKWSYNPDDMYQYYDFNKDGRLDVFDVIEARKAYLDGELYSKDVIALQEQVLTGEWNSEMKVLVVKGPELHSYIGDTRINRAVTEWDKKFVDYYIQDDQTIWMRFLNCNAIWEYEFQRETLFLKTVYFELDKSGHGIYIGYTEDGALAWDWSWNASEDESIVSFG